MDAYYLLNGWHGQSRHPVEIVGQTAKKYRCRLLEDGPLAGRQRWGRTGEVVLIPKGAVRVEEPAS